MIRHIVTWSFKDHLDSQQKQTYAKEMKEQLEALTDVIPGILSLEVIIDPLTTSNQEIALYSLFESPEALAAYQVHPQHVQVSEYVGAFLTGRACLDFTQ